jgi:hypothetical protein
MKVILRYIVSILVVIVAYIGVLVAVAFLVSNDILRWTLILVVSLAFVASMALTRQILRRL